MKEKTMSSRVCAFLTTIALLLSIVVPDIINTPFIYAAGSERSDPIEVDENSMSITSSSFTINGQQVNPGDDIALSSGDKVRFIFNWELDNDFITDEIRDDIFAKYDYVSFKYRFPDGYFGNVPIESPLFIDAGLSGQYYLYFDSDEGPYLIIESNKQVSRDEKDFYGSADCMGEIDLDVVEDKDDQKFDFEFFGETYTGLILPSFEGEKTHGELQFDDHENPYYVFIVRLKQTNEDISDIYTLSIQDIFDQGFYLYDAYNIKVFDCYDELGDTGYSDKYLLDLYEDSYVGTEYDSFDSISEIDVSYGNDTVLIYKIDVNLTEIIEGGNSDRTNQFIAKDEDGNTVINIYDTPKPGRPSIKKSGDYYKDEDIIAWSIKIDLAGYPIDTDSIVIREIPIGGITVDDVLNGLIAKGVEAYKQDEYVVIPFDAFDEEGILTFETKVDPSLKKKIDSTFVGNDVEMEFEIDDDNDDIFTVTDERSLEIPGVGIDFDLTKDVLTEEDGIITWQAEFDCPNIENIDSIDISDKMYGEQEFDPNSFMFSICNERDSNDKWNVEKSYKLKDLKAEYDEMSFSFIIKDSKIIDEVKGKHIIITYASEMFDEPYNDHVNTIFLTITVSNKPFSDSVSKNYAEEFVFQKDVIGEHDYLSGFDFGSLNLPKLWVVSVVSNDHKYVDGDTIIIKDTLPKEYEYVDGSAVYAINNGRYIWGYGFWNAVKFDSVDYDKSTGEIVFTVPADMLSGVQYISIGYVTSMKEEYFEHITDDLVNGTKTISISNKATAYINDDVIGSDSATQDVVIDANSIIKKTADGKLKNDKGDVGELGYREDVGNYVKYNIGFNEDRLDIVSGSDSVTIVDTLGTNLSIIPESIVVYTEKMVEYPWGSYLDKVYSYDCWTTSGNTITFTLEDRTYYHISYEAKITQVDALGEGQVYPKEYLEEHFDNKVAVKGAGAIPCSGGYMVSSQAYMSSSTIGHTSPYKYIKIIGTKMWDDASYDNIRPKSITVILTRHTYKLNEDGSLGDEYPDFLKNFTYEGLSASDVSTSDKNAWGFIIDDLQTEDVELGYFYKYDVKEVVVDGYSVTYNTVVEGLTTDDKAATGTAQDRDVSFTNKFTAPEDEIGSLTINKSWFLGTEKGKQPSKVDLSKLFTVKDNKGNTYDCIVKNSSVIFEKLPMFTYSRNSDDKLVRTPISYILTENPVEGFESSMTNNSYEFKFTDKAILDAKDIPANKNLTYNVTNTMKRDETKISFTAQKIWHGDSEIIDDIRPDSVKVELVGKVDDKIVYPTNGKAEIITITSNNNWSKVIENLPKYIYDDDYNKYEIKYSIEEVDVPVGYSITGYSMILANNASDQIIGESVTNTFNNEKTKIEITKTWKGDSEYKANCRPADITVNIIGDVASQKDHVYNKAVIIRGNSDTWTYMSDELPKYYYHKEADGTVVEEEIVYSVFEVSVEDYVSEGGSKSDYKTKDGYDGYTIMNDYVIESISVTVNKIDVTNSEEIDGATIQLLDENDNVLEEWISEKGKTKDFEGIVPGKTYKLREFITPYGYETAVDTIFIVKANEKGRAVKDNDGNLVIEIDGTDANYDDGVIIIDDKLITTEITIDKMDVLNSDEIDDATIVLFDENNKEIDRWISEKGKNKTFENLIPGKKYILREIVTPYGYETAVDTEFVIKADEQGYPVKDNDGKLVVEIKGKDASVDKDGVIIINDTFITTEITIDKVDILNSEEVDGATIILLDENGKEIDRWVSKSGEKKTFDKLVPGKKYTLREIVTPYGYETATDTIFSIEADEIGHVILDENNKPVIKIEGEDAKIENGVILINDTLITTEVTVNKMDILNSEEIDGAVITLLDEDDNEIDEWISESGKNKTFKNLIPGKKYTLKETITPYGYETATDTIFSIEADEAGHVVLDENNKPVIKIEGKDAEFKDDVIIINDTLITTEVTINKMDVANADEIDDAIIVLLDENGEEIDRWISKSGETKTFDNLIPGKKYVLREIITPYGYETAVDTEFVIKADEQGHVVLDENNKPVIEVKGKDGSVNEDNIVIINDTLITTEIIINKKDVANDDEIDGAVIVLLDENGNEIDRWTSEKGKNKIFKNLIPGEKYVLREIVTPYGYETAIDTIFSIEADETGHVRVDEDGRPVIKIEGKDTEIDNNIIIINDTLITTEVTINKMDVVNSKEIDGATIVLFDEDGNEIDSWVSKSGETKTFKNLIPGKKYTLKETIVADGYKVAADTIFSIEANETGHVVLDENGKVIINIDGKDASIKDGVIIINDTLITTDIIINKKDITNDEEIDGAKLEIFNENGDLIDEWISEKGKTKTIRNLIPGKKYTIRETVTPDGYETISTDIVFTVDRNGKIEIIEGKKDVEIDEDTGVLIINNSLKTTSVTINKMDIANNKEISGAELTVYDEDGNVIIVWISEEGKTKTIEGLIPGKTYILKETVTPDGYETISTDIVFTVDENGKITIIKGEEENDVKIDEETGIMIINNNIIINDDSETTNDEDSSIPDESIPDETTTDDESESSSNSDDSDSSDTSSESDSSSSSRTETSHSSTTSKDKASEAPRNDSPKTGSVMGGTLGFIALSIMMGIVSAKRKERNDDEE